MTDNFESRNPWKVRGEKKIYSNPWISVTEYDVLNPAGNKGIYGKIHFRNRAIGVLPLDEELNTWLVGQYRFPIDSYSWELPEGGGDMDTEPLESAKRELVEETGLIAEEWSELMRMHLSNSVSDELAIVFLARKLQEGPSNPEETEELVIRKLPFEEAYQMVEKGIITDSISVAAILKVKLLLTDGRIS
jgi:8-oxo-dGTP pyrophosphatase MutT (NUDIX family)